MVTIENLHVTFPDRTGKNQFTFNHVVDDASLVIGHEKLAIIGGSGSGKTMLAKALLGLVPKPGVVTAQRFVVFGQEMFTATEAYFQKIRGKQIAMVMQDPKFSLNPLLTVGNQIAESIRLQQISMQNNNKQQFSPKTIKTLVLDALAEVKIKDPNKTYSSYPFQLSGGMGQRVMLAMMLARKPKLLIADEATSALDDYTKNEILLLLDNFRNKLGMSILFISHDLDVVKDYCDRVLVMHEGRIVDQCEANKLYASKHPYTQKLLNCMPCLAKKGLSLIL